MSRLALWKKDTVDLSCPLAGLLLAGVLFADVLAEDELASSLPPPNPEGDVDWED